MIIEKYTPTELVVVESLSDTVRGEGGFGSTGVAAKPEQQSNGKKRDV